jgi:hypothetical protein
VYLSFTSNNAVDLAASLVAQSLRRAQTLSQAISGNAPWGVKVLATSTTLFQGVSYGTRNVAFDERDEFSEPVVVSGTSEIIFSKLYGYPQPTGTLELIVQTGDRRVLVIYEKGTISY